MFGSNIILVIEYIVGAMIFFFGVLVVVFRGAPFLPSFNHTVQKMVEMAEIGPNDRAADLGSGDGRIVIALAKEGIEAHGYEINPILFVWSWLRIFLAGVGGKAHIHLVSYWSTDLSKYSVVTVFGLTKIMPELQAKLDKELNPGTKVISNAFKFPAWEIKAESDEIYKYIIADK